MKKRVLALLLAGVMVLSMTACGNGTQKKGSSGKTVDGNELDADQYYNTYLSSDPTTLDSVKGNDTYGGDVLKNIMEPLTRLKDKDGKNVRVPAGAKSWESNKDGTVWTFKLADNKWSDGQPVTAEDYVYGIKRTLDPKSGSLNAYLITCIKNADAVSKGEAAVSELGVKAVDDKTLEITLDKATPYFLSLTDTRALLPQRKDIVEKYGETYGADADKIIGNGPFKVDKWTHNSELTLVKNKNYWDAGHVYLNRVTYKIMTDNTAVYNSFDNGSLDYVTTGTPEWMERFGKKSGVTNLNYSNATVRYHFFNTKDALFKNENIRKAFTIAINRKDVAKTIYFDTMKPAKAWVPESISTGEAGSYRKYAGNLMDDMLKEDPKELLLKGMKELGLGDDPSKLTVKFTLGGTNQWLRTYGEYFQQTFKKTLGVNIKLDQNEWGTFQSKTNSGDYQMAYMTWGADYNDPVSMLEIMKSDSGSIPTFWSNKEYDDLMGKAAVEMDDTKRAELCRQAEQILLNEAPICPVVFEEVHSYHYNYVKNTAETPFNTMGMKEIYTSGR